MKPGYEPKTLLGEMGQVMEEAGEVLQHMGKILRFGIDNVSPRLEDSALSNRQLFYQELDDLEACIKRIKARHEANWTEPLMVDYRDPYQGLAQAVQEYLEILSEADVEVKLDGVGKRGRLREAYRKVNALVGVALSKGTEP